MGGSERKFQIRRDPWLQLGWLMPHWGGSRLPLTYMGGDAYYCLSARHALNLGLEVLGLQAGDSVLLPAFHCQTAIDPFLSRGLKFQYYNILKNGKIDLADLKRKTQSNTKAVLIIHYFGLEQRLQEIIEWAQEKGIKIIEDYAHLIISGDSSGERMLGGDVAVFSWKKFFPIPDGGVLVFKNNRDGQKINWVEEDIRRKIFSWKRALAKVDPSSISGKILSKLSKISTLAKGDTNLQGNEEPNQQNSSLSVRGKPFTGLRMSKISQRIFSHLSVSTIVNKRTEYTRFFSQELGKIPCIKLWLAEVPRDVGLWAYPFIVENIPDFHVSLRDRGIEAFTWGGVIHSTLPLEQFNEANFLYQQLVMVPLHQDLAWKDLEVIVKCIKESVNNRIKCAEMISYE